MMFCALSKAKGMIIKMKTKTPKAKFLLTLPTELKEELKKESEPLHRSLNNYILWVLVKHLENSK